MKEKLDFFKKIWKNKRYRAIFVFLLYLLFFALMFIILFIKNSFRRPQVIEKEKRYEDYSIYSYNTILNINNKLYVIEGKRYNEKYEFVYDNVTYEFKIGEDVDVDKNVFTSFNFDPKYINNIIKKSKLLSETKIISDNILEKKYLIKLKDYIELNDIVLEEYDENLDLYITLAYKNNDVLYVDLQLDNLFKYYDNIFKYEIKITYSNIDSISSF